MAVLVTGGAGYIGSHIVLSLLEKGEDVVIIDNLSRGHKKAVKGGILYVGDLADKTFIRKVFAENDIESVIHLAAYSQVEESSEQPIKYYINNVKTTINLLEAMKDYGVKSLVFSSTAAVYGQTNEVPIRETAVTNPVNPYGESKLVVERMLKWASVSNDINYISLRYFNAAGAHDSGEIGEDHEVESHLIPIILMAAMGQREKVVIYGEDYDTEDGTCIRDYVHVMDLSKAHILALNRLRNTGKSGIYNLGSGKGYSVKQIVKTVERVTGINVPVESGGRRAGDAAVLIASSEKAKKELNWQPEHESIERIIRDAWRWHSNNAKGYNDKYIYLI